MATGNTNPAIEDSSPATELATLHQTLRQLQLDSDASAEVIAQIQHQIRATLPNPHPNGAPPHPKDPNGCCNTLHVNFSGGKDEQPDRIETGYLEFFAQVSKQLGLQLDVLTEAKWESTVHQLLGTKDLDQLHYSVVTSNRPISKWAEDSVEYLLNGAIATLPPFDDDLLGWAMTEGRRRRWQGVINSEHLEEALRDDGAWIPLGVRVNRFGMGQIRADVERARGGMVVGQPVGQMRAYIEGGNAIATTTADGRSLLLVGRDAIDATALMYQLGQNEVRQLIQADFGLENLDHVIVVEQPGQFHLDMGMLCLGNGVVVVNDSAAAYKDAVEMVEMVRCMTTEVMAAKATLQYQLEEQAVQDLVDAGLTVKRECLGEGVAYNFLNGEFVVGETGDRYFITNGGPSEHQARFETLMVNEWKAVDKVIFTPSDIAQNSLQEKGGIGCRAKGTLSLHLSLD